MKPSPKTCGRPDAGPAPTPAAARARYAARAAVLKALAHPVRLMFVDHLAGGERCVCELRNLAGLDLSTVSKHLTVLKNAGLIQDEKRGQWVYYRLCCPCLANFFTCIEGILKRQAAAKLKQIAGA